MTAPCTILTLTLALASAACASSGGTASGGTAATADSSTAGADTASTTDTAPAADTAAAADTATTGNDAATTGNDTAPASDAAKPADVFTGTCEVAPTVTGSSAIVINEVQGKTDDWVELYNAGNDTVSLGGMTLADKDSNGCPKLASALTFPASATLPKGGYLLVVGKKTPATGVQTKCLTTGGPKTCWQMAFKVSSTNGDGIFLVQNKQVVGSVAVPAGILSDTQSWGRSPNGTGDFKGMPPTPGAANQ